MSGAANNLLNLASQGSLTQGASLASSAASSVSNSVGGGIVKSIDGYIKNALNASISDIGKALVDATKLHLGNSFMSVYDAGLEIVAILAVFVLILGAIRGAATGNMSYIFQTVVRVAVAIVGSFLLVALVPKVESVFSAFSSIFATSFGSNASGFSAKFLTLIMVSSFTTGAAMTFIILGVLILMAIFTTSVVLGLSGVVAYIAAMFAPFAFLISTKAAKKTLEVLIVALATPTIITAIFALGLAVFSASAPTASSWIGSTFEGLGILLLAAFSPLGVMKLLPFGEEAIAKMGAHHQQVKSSAQSVWGYKSAKDIATMENPALAEVQAKLRAHHQQDTSATSGGDTQATPQNGDQTGPTAGSTGSGTGSTPPNNPNPPNSSNQNPSGESGNNEPPDSNQPPPPPNPKDKP